MNSSSSLFQYPDSPLDYVYVKDGSNGLEDSSLSSSSNTDYAIITSPCPPTRKLSRRRSSQNLCASPLFTARKLTRLNSSRNLCLSPPSPSTRRRKLSRQGSCQSLVPVCTPTRKLSRRKSITDHNLRVMEQFSRALRDEPSSSYTHRLPRRQESMMRRRRASLGMDDRYF